MSTTPVPPKTAGSDSSAPAIAPDGSPTAVRTGMFGGLRIGWDTILSTTPIYVGLIAIWIYFDVQTSGIFIGARNLSEMAQEYSYKPVLALGIVFVLLLGEIDLSLGYLTLLSVTTTAVFSFSNHWSAGAAILGAVILCTLCGLAQGFLIAWVRMPAFVVTLGGFLIFEGISYHLVGGNTINVFDPFISSIGTYYLPDYLSWIIAAAAVVIMVLQQLNQRRLRTAAGLSPVPIFRSAVPVIAGAVLLAAIVLTMNAYRGVPIALAVLGAFTVVAWFFSTRTRFGRHIYAVGGNQEASRRAGINTTAVRWIVFGISGMMAGFAGIMLVGQAAAASTTTAGPDLLLDVISIAVIGGVSLTGGRGSVWGVLLGGLLIASVDSGLNLEATDPNYVYVIKGAILLLAILIDVVGKRRGSFTLPRLLTRRV